MATQKEIVLCQEILGLSIEINMTSNYNVWVDFAGHVKSIEVRVTNGKWSDQVETPYLSGWGLSFDEDAHRVYLSTDYKLGHGESMDDVIDYKVEKLEKIKAALIALLNGESA